MRTYAPDLQTYIDRARPGARLPIVVELPLDARTPIEIYHALRGRFGLALLLESGKSGRYSYVGLPAREPFRSSGRTVTRPDRTTVEADPFDEIRTLLDAEELLANELLTGFAGGYVGYLGYDMARHIERLPELTAADPIIPDCELFLVERFCEIDHDGDLLRLVVAARCGVDTAASFESAIDLLEEMARVIEVRSETRASLVEQPVDVVPADDRSLSEHDARTASGSRMQLEASLSATEFEAIVGRALAYIRAGDIFQVNLSVRFASPFDGDPLELYRALRAINPAPYMSLLELPELAIASASPELLVRVRGKVVETRPIAGTRPRGATAEEDERNARKLAANEKERAEHLMLVDLERNDLGRVCRYGSVRVEEFMGIERYSHVIHIVSHIRGELADGRDTVDAIRACFPGGTITGAPKVRSMEIIEELEPQRRGVYTGSIGWLGFDGSAELNIAIRTIVVVDGIAYAQAGAGIVYDSVPQHEYRESVRKAEAALEALERTRHVAP